MRFANIANSFPEHKEYLSQQHPLSTMALVDPSGRKMLQLFEGVLNTEKWSKDKETKKLAKNLFQKLNKAAKNEGHKHKEKKIEKGHFVLASDVKADFEALKKIYKNRHDKVEVESAPEVKSESKSAPKSSNNVAEALKKFAQAANELAESICKDEIAIEPENSSEVNEDVKSSSEPAPVSADLVPADSSSSS